MKKRSKKPLLNRLITGERGEPRMRGLHAYKQAYKKGRPHAAYQRENSVGGVGFKSLLNSDRSSDRAIRKSTDPTLLNRVENRVRGNFKPTIKNLLKGTMLFDRMLYFEHDFIKDLKDLLEKWNPSWQDGALLGRAIAADTSEEMWKKNTVAQKQLKLFLGRLKEAEVAEFENDIFDLLKKYGFGKEWLPVFANFIVTCWLLPPFYNFYLSQNDGEEGRKRVVLELNPDTSIDDLKATWSLIQKQQKKLYPTFKKRNLSLKSKQNLDRAIEDLKKPMPKPDWKRRQMRSRYKRGL